MRVPVEVLVVLCVVVGVVPAQSIGPSLAAASRQVVGGPLPEYTLKVWHGVTPALVMSAIALAGGAVLYVTVHRFVRRGRLATDRFLRPAGAKLFFGALASLTCASRKLRTRLLTAGLQRQLLLLAVVTLVIGVSTLAAGVGRRNRPLVPLSPAFAGLWVVGAAAATAAAVQAKFHRLAALILAGTAGAICCVTFIWFSAPDLALTQLSVEVVTTLLILLGLRWLPRRAVDRSVYDARTRRLATVRRTRDFLVAAAAGLGMAALSFAVMTRDFPERTSFYLEKALSEGGGRNVVNVMLVDFRGFDTFGEGIVLAVVALAVYALLRRFRPASEVMALPPQQQALPKDLQTDLVNPRHVRDPAVGYLTVPAVLVRLVLPVSGVVAVFFFLRGHNQPGGGFVAGLIMSLGLLLQYIVSGTEWVEERVRLRPRALIAVGILLTVVTASAPIFAGYPLLTSHTFHVRLPLFGDVHVASATFFDLGVFCIVLGSILLILVALAHQSVRAHRASGDQ
jgi:multicomponent K+:H+ antiporter subunit A